MTGCRTLNKSLKNLKSSLGNLEVDVRPSRSAGRADLGDHISTPDAISDPDEVGLVMAVKHGLTVVRFDHDGVSITAFRSTFHHDTVGYGSDLGSVRGGDIRSFVKTPFSGDRIPPPPHR